jgi:hypothetical protein
LTLRGGFSHRGELCSFDGMPMEFGLSIGNLRRQWLGRRA